MIDIRLNSRQQEAVDHIYGPLLVLAGPGTGKTQLLSARIANILSITDASPQNILCLTFTEAAAQNMRERLAGMIGAGAYDVHINTYHGFGSDIIRSYPSYFENVNLETGEDTRLERPIDDLQRIQIFTELINRLPYSSPLIGAKHYVKHIASTVSELKRGLYTPDSLQKLADRNLSQVRALSPKIADHLADVVRFPSNAQTAIELFEGILQILEGHDGLVEIAREELETAMTLSLETNKSKHLTDWKNAWLTKDSDNRFRFTDEDQHLRIAELAKLYAAYDTALASKQLYDFDDMILRTIEALQTKDELRFNLQEKYQYILLDEFQDTNAAQFELVKQLADNPVNEGRPNIFAVGDDDQAIYAFQGARVSNMIGFVRAFRDVQVINLTENYRSHSDILHIAKNIATQIESRLHDSLDGIEKTLIASNANLPKKSTIERREFDGQANEYAWVAAKIQELIERGTRPSEIAVLAPKHSLLEQLVPFLVANNTSISYEKRENILETQLIKTFHAMIQLVIASGANNSAVMNQLFPQILSLDFYQIPVIDIWQINWEASGFDQKLSWAELAQQNPRIAPHVTFFLALGLKASTEPLEYILDYLTGSTSLKLDKDTSYISPLKNYYFDPKNKQTLQYFEALANLSTIREHLRNWQAGQDTLLTAQDFLNFVAAYAAADQPLINTHPVAQSSDSVQLMTAYKAKGLEFENVFLLSVHDDVWGKKARSNSNKFSLPANLQHVRYQGSDEDELRRILFVAITRAKHGLYLTSHLSKDNGKSTEPVKYLLEYSDGEQRLSTVLPDDVQALQHIDFSAPETMQQVEILWQSRHLNLTTDLKALLKPRLDKYQMSPTHLNMFIDTEHGGAEVFLLQTLLRFPQAPNESGEFGNAIHETLEWIQVHNIQDIEGNLPKILTVFDQKLAHRYLPADRMDDLRARGRHALTSYLQSSAHIFRKTAKSEIDFRSEGVFVGEAHLSGKIDRIEINDSDRTIDIVDFKTGTPMAKWDTSIKAQKYKQQLYFYKFLIEGSHAYKSYKVNSARLEFVEQGDKNEATPPLYVDFSLSFETEIKDLIIKTWAKIQNLDLV